MWPDQRDNFIDYSYNHTYGVRIASCYSDYVMDWMTEEPCFDSWQVQLVILYFRDRNGLAITSHVPM